MNTTTRHAVSTLVCAALVGGCAAPNGHPRAPRDHAFINYRGSEQSDGRLRLAVKDLIDVKGEVTTAGSRVPRPAQPSRHRGCPVFKNRPRAECRVRREDESQRIRHRTVGAQ